MGTNVSRSSEYGRNLKRQLDNAVRQLTLYTPMRDNRTEREWTRDMMVARSVAQRETAAKTAEIAKQMEYGRKYTTHELYEMGAR